MNTKEKILKVAQKLFVTQGVDKTSTAQICKEAGIASGTLFVHFKRKQDLIDAIYLEKKQKSFRYVATFLDENASVKENILKLSEAIISYYIENFEDFKYFQLLERGPIVSKEAKEIYKKEVAGSMETIKAWQKTGELKDMDTCLLMNIWWGILMAFIQKFSEEPQKKPSADELKVIWDALKA